MRKLFIVLIFILAIFGCQEMGNGGSGGGKSSGKSGNKDKLIGVRGSNNPMALLDLNSDFKVINVAYDLTGNGVASANIETNEQNQVIRLTLIPILLTDDITIFEYEYENNRVIDRKTYWKDKNDVLTFWDHRTYTYYPNGNLEKRIYKDGKYNYCEYDSDNNIVKMSNYLADDTFIGDYVEYAYDSSNRLIKKDNYNNDIFSDTFEYEYDGLNVTIKYENFNGVGASWYFVSFRTYSVEHSDFLLSEMRYNCGSDFNPIGDPQTWFFQYDLEEGSSENNDWFEKFDREENPIGWY